MNNQKSSSPVGDNKSTDLPSAFSLFNPSIRALRINIVTILALALIPVLVVSLPAAILAHNHKLTLMNNPRFATNVAALIAVFIAFVWLLISVVGLQFTLLRSAQNKKVSYSEAFYGGIHYFWKIILLGICSGILIIIGLILLIIPGIFLIQRLLLAPYFLIDKDLSVKDTIKKCYKESKKFSKSIWGILGVLLLINLIAIIPILGSLISATLGVLYYCAPALRYEQIKQKSD